MSSPDSLAGLWLLSRADLRATREVGDGSIPVG